MAKPVYYKSAFVIKESHNITTFSSTPEGFGNVSETKKVKSGYNNLKTKALPRIAIAGLGIESSTFSPALTNEEAFHAKYGADVFSSYPFLSVDSPLRGQAEWIPTLVGKSLPGGAVIREAYESLVNKTLIALKKAGHTMAFF